jgi:hypothetical protein
MSKSEIPFHQRVTCSINEACDVSGLGRTSIHYRIKDGTIKTTKVGTRHLVIIRSLLAMLDPANNTAA